MTPDLARLLAAIAGVVLLVAIGKVALIPANRLGISVFRPYRGDPWPVGVQEDDDARFRWTRPGRPTDASEALQRDPLDGVAARPRRQVSQTDEPARLEEVAAVDLEARPISGGAVHRVRH
jgi:hypothetical protein